MRKSVLHYWSIGGKEITLGNKEEGFKKMQAYLDEQKKAS